MKRWNEIVEFWKTLFEWIRSGHFFCLRLCSKCDQPFCRFHMHKINGELFCSECFGSHFTELVIKHLEELIDNLFYQFSTSMLSAVEGFAIMGTTIKESSDAVARFGKEVSKRNDLKGA